MVEEIKRKTQKHGVDFISFTSKASKACGKGTQVASMRRVSKARKARRRQV